ncbi:MAG TPA: hypothetical protein VNW04_23030 [Puia sp.]|jgi:hypothetical protein|nr:hypothetical protein [Puia sp.]
MAKKDKNTIDMPEVSDIPGQEHIRPPRLGELADETASSADEEGDETLGPLDKADDGGIGLDARSNVSKDERSMLAGIDRRRDESEDEPLRTGLLDSTDEDGTPLNEKSFGSERNDDLSADDLDVPRVGDDEPGEEDEENEDYSLSDNNDDTEINTDQ